MNIEAQVPLRYPDFNYLEYIPKLELMDHIGVPFLNF
jgi:hypothetical protein